MKLLNRRLVYAIAIRLLRVVIGIALSVVISRSFGVDVLGRFVLMEKIVAGLIVGSSIYTLPLIVSLVKEKAIVYGQFIRVNLLCYLVLMGISLAVSILYYGFSNLDVVAYLFAGVIETITITTSFYLIAQGKVASAGVVDGTLKLGFLIIIIFIFYIIGYTSKFLLPFMYFFANGLALFVIYISLRKTITREKVTLLTKNDIKIKFYISRVVNYLIRNANILLASFLLSSIDVGYYTVAIKISFSFALLYQITTNWQLSSIKKSLMINENLEYVRRISRITLLTSVIVTFIIFIFLRPIVGLWSIEKESIIMILIMLLLAQIINVSVGPVEQVLLLCNHESWNAKLNIVSLPVQLVLMFVLGKLFGLQGVVLGEILVFIIGNLLRYLKLRTLNIVVGIL